MALPDSVNSSFKPAQLRAVEQAETANSTSEVSNSSPDQVDETPSQRERLSTKAQLYSTLGALACISATYASHKNGNILASTSFGSMTAIALSLPGTEYALRLKEKLQKVRD